MALYLVIQVGAFLSRIIPRPWRYLIGTAVGDAVFWVWRSKRKVLLENEAIILGKPANDREVRRLALKSMRNYCKYLIEFLELPVLSPQDQIIRSMKISGLEHLQAALEEGRGVILASAHFGTIEVGGLRLSDFTDFHAVYDTFSPPYLDRLIQRKRREKGIDLIPVTNIREMIRVLRADGSLVMLYDRPVSPDKGVPVTFFGRPTAVPGGPAALALKTGAKLIPVYMFRQPDKSFESVLFPPITYQPTGDRDADIRAVTQQLMDTLETVVRERPDQWYMFRPMWPEVARHAVQPSPSVPLTSRAFYWLLRAASLVVPRVPRTLAYALAHAAGAGAYYVVPAARHGLTDNLRLVIPDANERALRTAARRVFENDAKNWVDTMRIPTLSSEKIAESIEVEGWEHVEEALALGKGLIMVTLHLGNFDLVGQLIAIRGLRLTVPVERMQPQELFDLLTRRRAANGINIVPIDRAPREMLAALRRGEIVGVAGDRGAGGKTVRVSLFGSPMDVPRGPVALAHRTGAPVLIALGIRRKDNNFQGYVTPPVPLSYRAGAENEQRDAQAIVDAFAPFLRRFPDQWLAFSPVVGRKIADNHAATMGQHTAAV